MHPAPPRTERPATCTRVLRRGGGPEDMQGTHLHMNETVRASLRGAAGIRHGRSGSPCLHSPGGAAERRFHGIGSENKAVFRPRFQGQKCEGTQCAFTLLVPNFGAENGRFFGGRFPDGPDSGMRTGPGGPLDKRPSDVARARRERGGCTAKPYWYGSLCVHRQCCRKPQNCDTWGLRVCCTG